MLYPHHAGMFRTGKLWPTSVHLLDRISHLDPQVSVSVLLLKERRPRGFNDIFKKGQMVDGSEVVAIITA